MFINSKQFARTFTSVLILACFIFNMVPNQVIYNENFVTNESPIITNESQSQISRSDNYDLGIDSIFLESDSDYWKGSECSTCFVVEAFIPKHIEVKITNHGSQSVDELIVSLRIKSVEGGLVQYNNTFTSEAFPEGHPMHISTDNPLESGSSVILTFNKTNDRHQRMFDGEDPYRASHSLFLLTGVSYLQANIIGEDSDSTNNHYREDVEVVKWIDNGEDPWDESGPGSTIGDTNDNGGDSFDGVNIHRSTDFDHDADGCGWSRECTADEGTDNVTSALAGNSAYSTFNSLGWYKEDAGSDECNWEGFGDNNCPKFTSQTYQDDYVLSPGLDLSGMEEIRLGFAYRGILEEGDILNIQVTKDGVTWENIWNITSESNSMDWSNLQLDTEYFEDYIGSEDTDTIYFRFQAFSDGDETTECGNSPCSIFFIDEIIIFGNERVTRDVAVLDITVDQDFVVKDGEDSLSREINATIFNAGASPWANLPVRFTVENLQGEDLSYDYLDTYESLIYNLESDGVYGDLNLDEQQRELFVEFYTPGANVYTITVEILVPAGKDFFPENNTMTVSFRVLDTFFSDGFDIDNNGYTEVQRTTSEENRWLLVHKENYAYSGEYAYQYAEDETHDSENPTTAGGSDDGLITMDEWDRDGESDKFGPDVNLDLRAAYKPILNFAIKWDFANDDRLEVRAATDFDSTDKHNSGTWIVIKTYEGDCGCPMLSEDKETWVLEELSLESFEGYRTWIEFRVITNTGGGKGVLIDDLAVLGNEYRNNIMITEVGLGDQSPELDNELSVTIRGAGLEPQESVTVAAKILDVNGQQVWPTTSEFTWFTISETLSKSEEYIVNIDTAGSDWKYGSELEEGTYFINVMAFRDDDLQVPDENPNNNMWFEEFVLVKIDADSDGVTDDIDECLGTPSDEEVDAVGCSNSQKDSDGDNITDDIDECLETPSGEEADTVGCSNSQKDSDSDNITDDIDECPSTASGEEVDQLGCSPSQKDSDNDGVSDAEDQCPDTLSDEEVGEAGCSSSQKDSDNDGISDAGDKCLNTPVGKQVDEEGCSNSQKDSDNDGITDDKDECDSPSGEKVDELGCKFEEPVVNDNTIVSDTGSNNTNLDDSGPIVESLDEEEIEVPSLGLIAVIFSVFSIAVLRRR